MVIPNDLLYNVEKVPLNEVLPNMAYNSDIDNAIVVHTPGGRRIVNFCSDSYELISNRDFLVPLIDSFEKEFGNFEIKSHTHNYSQFFIDFVFKDLNSYKITSADVLFPSIRLTNSYDGKKRFQYSGGIYRLVCENGLSVLEEEFAKTNLVHMKSLGELINSGKIHETSYKIIKSFDELNDDYEYLKSQKIGRPDLRIEQVIEDTKLPNYLGEGVLYVVEQEKVELGIPNYNDWLIYNGINYQLHHDPEINMAYDKLMKTDKEVLKYLIEN